MSIILIGTPALGSAPPPSVTGITFSPAAPTVADNATVGTFVTTVTPQMSDGSSFPVGGTYTLTVDDSGKFTITDNGDGTANITVFSSLSGDGGTDPSINVEVNPNNTTGPFDQAETIHIATSGGDVLLTTVNWQNPTASTVVGAEKYFGVEIPPGMLDNTHHLEWRQTVANGGAVLTSHQGEESFTDGEVRYCRAMVAFPDTLTAGANRDYDGWIVPGAPDHAGTFTPADALAGITDYSVQYAVSSADANNGTWIGSAATFFAGTEFTGSLISGENCHWMQLANSANLGLFECIGYLQKAGSPHYFMKAIIWAMIYPSGKTQFKSWLLNDGLVGGYSGGSGVSTAAQILGTATVYAGATALRSWALDNTLTLPGTASKAQFNFTSSCPLVGGNNTGLDGVLNDCDWDTFDAGGTHIQTDGTEVVFSASYLNTTRACAPVDLTTTMSAPATTRDFIPYSYLNASDYGTYNPEGRLLGGENYRTSMYCRWDPSNTDARRQLKITGHVTAGWPLIDIYEESLMPVRIHPSGGAWLGTDYSLGTRRQSSVPVTQTKFLPGDGITAPWGGHTSGATMLDASHLPEYNFAAGLVYGDPIYTYLQYFLAQRVNINELATYRNKNASQDWGTGPGTAYYGIPVSQQPRGHAWSTRTSSDAAFLCPDFLANGTTPHPLKTQIKAIVADQWAFYAANVAHLPAGLASLGLYYPTPTNGSTSGSDGRYVGISAISQANPGVVTCNFLGGAYDWIDGTFATFKNTSMTGVNNQQYKMKNTNAVAGTFELTNKSTGANIDTSGFTAFTALSGSLATVSGLVVNLSADAPDLSGVVNGTTRITLPSATNFLSQTFVISAHDNTAKTVTLSSAPTGISGSTNWIIGGTFYPTYNGSVIGFQERHRMAVAFREVWRGGDHVTDVRSLVDNCVKNQLLIVFSAADDSDFTADDELYWLPTYDWAYADPGGAICADLNAQLRQNLISGSPLGVNVAPPVVPSPDGTGRLYSTTAKNGYGLGWDATAAIAAACSGFGPYSTPAGLKTFADVYSLIHTRVLADSGSPFSTGWGSDPTYNYAPP